MKRNIKFYWMMVTVFTVLSAACTPASTPAGPQVPVTGATTAVPAPAAVAPAAPGPSAGGLKFVLVPGKSEASYTVREQLARLNFPSDAVGKTNSLSGSISINADGSLDKTNSKFTVDLTTLKTDEPMRDGFVSRNVLHTSQYPNAVFVPTAVSGLPMPIPQSGSVSFKLSGDMTLLAVTKPVTWDVSGTINDGAASGKATTSFTFEDFNLTPPHISVVLSIVDKINLAVTGDLQRSGG